jgi:hypothetical protein
MPELGLAGEPRANLDARLVPPPARLGVLAGAAGDAPHRSALGAGEGEAIRVARTRPSAHLPPGGEAPASRLPELRGEITRLLAHGRQLRAAQRRNRVPSGSELQPHG